MPIRINLLAEEQAAEEMRRRDPVKRAIIAGVALVVLMLAWIALTQLNVNNARAELARYQADLSKVEEASKLVRSNQLVIAEMESRMKALEKYSTNRFLWASFLDAIQHAAVDNVRLTEIKAVQNYFSGEANKFFVTNIAVPYVPPAPFWKFWARGSPVPVGTVVSNKFSAITNSPPFTTNLLNYKVGVTIDKTNLVRKEVTAKVEFVSVPWAMEQTVVQISGRDYGTEIGAGAKRLLSELNNSPYLKPLLKQPRFADLPAQPSPPDAQDPDNPTSQYLRFTIELVLKERILTNE